MFTYEKRPVLPTRMWWCAYRQAWWAHKCYCSVAGSLSQGCGWVDRFDAMQISDPENGNPQ